MLGVRVELAACGNMRLGNRCAVLGRERSRGLHLGRITLWEDPQRGRDGVDRAHSHLLHRRDEDHRERRRAGAVGLENERGERLDWRTDAVVRPGWPSIFVAVQPQRKQ
jgi:hypothetical protein